MTMNGEFDPKRAAEREIERKVPGAIIEHSYLATGVYRVRVFSGPRPAAIAIGVGRSTGEAYCDLYTRLVSLPEATRLAGDALSVSSPAVRIQHHVLPEWLFAACMWVSGVAFGILIWSLR